MKTLRDILFEGGEVGYQPGTDAKMVPQEPGGEARFVLKHLVGEKKKATDIDSSTLDDKLFKAVNIKRAVPEPGENRHGHVPHGKDDKVYEAKDGLDTMEKTAKKVAKKAGAKDVVQNRQARES